MFRNQNRFSFMSIGLAKLMKRRIASISAVRAWLPRFHLARDHAGGGDPGNDGDRNFSLCASEPDCAAVLIGNSGRRARNMTAFVICLQLNGKA